MTSQRSAALLVFVLALPVRAEGAVTVYVAKTILTMDAAGSTAEAVAVENGRIVAVGSRAAVLEAMRGTSPAVDTRFERDVMLPGFIEPHSHFSTNGLYSSLPYIGYFDVPMPDGTVQKGARTPADMIRRLREAVEAEPDAPLVLATGADPIYFGGRHFTAAFLDQASSTRPILIELSSGHIVVANTPMLRILERHPQWKTLLPTPGVVKDAFGHPTGELDELAALSFAFSVAGRMRPDLFVNPVRQMRALRDAAELARRAGVTTATDHLFGFGTKDVELVSRDYYAAATSREDFPVRVMLVYLAPSLLTNWGAGAVEHMNEVKKKDTDKLRTAAIKFVFDGSPQGYTGQLFPDPGYWNGAGNPIWNMTEAEFVNAALPFWNARYQVKGHVNGDASVEALLGGLAALQKQSAWADHRTTFEHVPVASREQYRRIAAAGANVNLFANHISYWGDQHSAISLGPERAANLAAAATAKESKIPYSFHSDAPVTPSRPLFAIWCAVNRQTPNGGVLGASEKITVLDGLLAVTRTAAFLLRMENEIGSIEPGKRADFTILGENPLTVPPQTIRDIPVRATVLGGRVFQ